MEQRKEIRLLPVELTEEEHRDRGKALGAALEAQTELEVELKDFSEDQKSKIKEQQKRARALSRVVVSGQENREVECVWTPDHTSGLMVLWRLDTGVQVDSRPLTLAEKQRNLFPIDGGRRDEANAEPAADQPG